MPKKRQNKRYSWGEAAWILRCPRVRPNKKTKLFVELSVHARLSPLKSCCTFFMDGGIRRSSTTKPVHTNKSITYIRGTHFMVRIGLVFFVNLPYLT